MVQLAWWFSFLLWTLLLSLSGVISVTFTLVNQCNYTVWPASYTTTGNQTLSTTVLNSGESSTITAPPRWNGRLWGRTLCSADHATGNFSCLTRKVSKSGSPPATLVQFSLNRINSLDFYDVSLVDGYNVPVAVTPSTGTGSCSSTSGDSGNKTFTCATSSDYNITFCLPPSSNIQTSNRLLVEGQLGASVGVSSSLTAGSGITRWLSPSGEFAFGFYQLPNELFLLAIWFESITNETTIWYANGDNPAPKGSKLELNDSQGLVLTTPQGSVLWKSYFTSGTVSSGLMNDTGNFQLRDKDSVVLWDSFSHPTDTLVPTQVMELNDNLASRQGEFNFSGGRFKLCLQEDGNFVFNLINLPNQYSYKPYYSTGTADANNLKNVGQRLIFDKAGFLYILKKSGEYFFITNPRDTYSTDSFYYKATFNYDGVLTISYYPKSSQNGTSWVVIKTMPENICLKLNSTCGFNSICSLKDDQRPMCTCQNGYSLIDSNNPYDGCLQNSQVICQSGGCGGSKHNKNDHDTLIIVISVLFGSSVFVILMLIGSICFGFPYNHKKIKRSRIKPSEGFIDKTLRNFTFKEIEEATSNFREVLGRGSCGIVYNGVVDMIGVAVKKLDKLFQDSDKEFQTEMNVIGQTHHRNLVRLLGYCNEGQHRILVYELMSNGTLASFLFTPLKPNWNQRVHIALGVARGLVYLHEECCSQIIHCDIKPQNILLDDHHNARISDFGLAKRLLINQSRTETGIRGTRGYVAPDWFRNAPITAKADTYSFGVLLLEIICCRKNVEKDPVDDEKGILSDWAYDCYKSKRLDILLENDSEAANDIKSFEKFVMIAIWCIQEDPCLRPTMKEILHMLEGVVEVAFPPGPYLYGSVSCN